MTERVSVNSRKILILALLAVASWSNACSKPVRAELGDVCSEPEGTVVTVEGYIRLPEMMETIQQMRDGRITAVGHQPLLAASADATRDAVKLTVWTTTAAEPNRIKAFSSDYSWEDWRFYADDGKEVPAGKVIRVTGEIVRDEKTGCAVSVTKIEQP